MTGFSKHATKTLIYPDPTERPDEFLSWLQETIIREHVDVLFALDDDILSVVVPHQTELSKLCRLSVPRQSSFSVASDKALTMRLAAERGVKHPRTVTTLGLAPLTPDLLFQLTEHMRYPLVLKPRVGSGSRGVRFAQTPNDLPRVFDEVHNQYPHPLIQEAIPYGGKVDVCLLYDAHHEVRAAFVQREVRNYPNVRGPSVVRESVHDERLLSTTIALMEGIPWTGVAEVDYIIDSRTGEAVLLEINPRYWSSLHLSIDCGVDFPWMDFKLAMEMDVDVAESYPDHSWGRQLLPGDLLYFLTEPGRWDMQPPFFSTNYTDDVVSLRDFGPTLGFSLSALRFAFSPKMWKFLITR